uniref:SHSP domain-containing protein n=1 Tax=Zea mays TaxID=4577 RepID=A0A804NXL8_MAIZE
MASIVASRRAVPLVRALEKLIAASSAPGTGSALRPVAVAGGLRGYNTGAPLRRYEGAESEDDSVREYDGRHGGRDYAVPSLFSGRAVRRGWNAKEDEEALHLRVDMPGLGKEHVKVWAEQNSLVIKGEGEKEDSEDEAAPPPRYSGRIELAPEVYRMDKIKAEMKNGVLKVVVPKVKEQQRKDVFQVNVE